MEPDLMSYERCLACQASKCLNKFKIWTIYFHFMKENYGVDEQFWSNSIDNPSRRAWTGLVFEQLCKDHIKQIKNKLVKKS